ncbi:MAG: trypsin-like peptidase domain-containing protein [Deltaproteobacteria bacterium]|nr:trypsin-like peptidase domain-containing protein [Deltaproteobacteria bacterium]MBW2659260.1 trypsin-like peptidase domain-containing protein [Deltaproteobacteria bacterium]
MRCPKCNHEQRNTEECESCGLIFARYRTVQKRKKEAGFQESRGGEKGSGGAMKLFQFVLLAAVVAATTYYFVREKGVSGPSHSLPAHQTVAKTEQPVKVAEKVLNRKNSTQIASRSTGFTGNGIELARRATVSIETPWGTGSGFFVNQYYIVTNRHVIEFDKQKIEEFREKIETARRMIDLEKQKLKDFRRKLRQYPKGPSRSQLALIIETRQKELDKVLPQQEEREAKLEQLTADIQPSDIKIIMADGSEHQADDVLLSDNYDLALMSLFSGEYNFLSKPPGGRKLFQGESVYTVGSPVGLRNTVTAGVFSGYRRIETDGEVLLQTDAAINPGNSGGPLIDGNGYVYGVNTMILRDTEGIGFAIPIERVFEEFSSTLY